MVEVQSHGFKFETWVRDNFFSGYEGDYMQKWDVPPEENISKNIPEKYQNIAVSIKASKIGSPIGLGDIFRQREINQDFLMIAGFWTQRRKNEKWFVEIGISKFLQSEWDSLWGELSIEEIKKIDTVIKNRSYHYSTVRKKAQEWKRNAFVQSSTIVVNPKIDTRGQRRIQCSLPYKVFWRFVGRNPIEKDYPKLWGSSFPNPVFSKSRTFNT